MARDDTARRIGALHEIAARLYAHILCEGGVSREVQERLAGAVDQLADAVWLHGCHKRVRAAGPAPTV